jgi:hypothetical protein
MPSAFVVIASASGLFRRQFEAGPPNGEMPVRQEFDVNTLWREGQSRVAVCGP